MIDGIPPMKPFAAIIDQMLVIAQEEIPAPRTCRVRLYDDSTFRASVSHSMGTDERQAIIYDRTTSEIFWEHIKSARTKTTPLSGGETIHESVRDDQEMRVIAQVNPPYK